MNSNEKLEKLRVLEEELENLESTIRCIQIGNYNAGINAPEQIDTNDSVWKKFVDDVINYFKMFGEEGQYIKFHEIINAEVINENVLDGLRYFFDHLKK